MSGRYFGSSQELSIINLVLGCFPHLGHVFLLHLAQSSSLGHSGNGKFADSPSSGLKSPPTTTQQDCRGIGDFDLCQEAPRTSNWVKGNFTFCFLGDLSPQAEVTPSLSKGPVQPGHAQPAGGSPGQELGEHPHPKGPTAEGPGVGCPARSWQGRAQEEGEWGPVLVPQHGSRGLYLCSSALIKLAGTQMVCEVSFTFCLQQGSMPGVPSRPLPSGRPFAGPFPPTPPFQFPRLGLDPPCVCLR